MTTAKSPLAKYRRYATLASKTGMIAMNHTPRALWAVLLLSVTLAGRASTQALAADALPIDGGSISIPAETDGVIAFKGLPYAAPPVGSLRWRAPAPVSAWAGVRPADTFAPDCMQKPSDASPASRPRSEDCLYLNIWTAPLRPELRAVVKTGRPVFVWIHGGGSRVGSGAQPQFDGSSLARRGIVVVTINYRLGPFGFLSTHALSAESSYGGSGDYGLMDDMAALRWVKRNIATFGGDPTRVTVGGESSGSVSTGALMASPMAAGLFQQAIGESGSVFRVAESGSMGATNLVVEEAKGDRLADAVDAHDLSALRAVPAQSLLAAAENLHLTFNLPVVDGHILPASPWRLFQTHRFNDVPLLIGWNRDEGSVQLMGPHTTLPQLLSRYYGSAASELAQYYQAPPSDGARALVDAAGDNGIAYPTWKWGVAQQRFGQRPLYVYRFDRAPPISEARFGKALDVKLAGAFHGSEIVYVFDSLSSEPTWAIDDDDRRIARQMSSYWENFIKAGDPNSKGLPDWPRYTLSRSAQRMQIGLTTRAVADPDYDKYTALMAAHQKIDPPEPSAPVK